MIRDSSAFTRSQSASVARARPLNRPEVAPASTRCWIAAIRIELANSPVLRNAVQNVCDSEQITAAGLRPELLAEEVEVVAFIKLSNALSAAAGGPGIR